MSKHAGYGLEVNVSRQRASWRRRWYTQAGPVTVRSVATGATTRVEPAYDPAEHANVLAGPGYRRDGLQRIQAAPSGRHHTRRWR